MDITGADFFAVVKTLRERLNANAVPVQLPVGAEDAFNGIIDLIRMKMITYTDDLGTRTTESDIPAELLTLARKYREKMLEAISEL